MLSVLNCIELPDWRFANDADGVNRRRAELSSFAPGGFEDECELFARGGTEVSIQGSRSLGPDVLDTAPSSFVRIPDAVLSAFGAGASFGEH